MINYSVKYTGETDDIFGCNILGKFAKTDYDTLMRAINFVQAI